MKKICERLFIIGYCFFILLLPAALIYFLDQEYKHDWSIASIIAVSIFSLCSLFSFYVFVFVCNLMDINWHYLTFKPYNTNKRIWFKYGAFWGILLLLNHPFNWMEYKWIIIIKDGEEEKHIPVEGFSSRIWYTFTWFYYRVPVEHVRIIPYKGQVKESIALLN